MHKHIIITFATLTLTATAPAQNQAPAASSSLMAQAMQQQAATNRVRTQTGNTETTAVSMFEVPLVEAREFKKHDLIQIVIRESTVIDSEHELTADKGYELGGRVSSFEPFLGAQDLPDIRMEALKGFEGDGEYERTDDYVGRISAEIIEILPNGNLVIEARTFIKTDEEEQHISLTGICRPDDIMPNNTVLSSQIHDLNVIKNHKGELKKANQKGILAQLADFLFAW